MYTSTTASVRDAQEDDEKHGEFILRPKKPHRVVDIRSRDLIVKQLWMANCWRQIDKSRK